MQSYGYILKIAREKARGFKYEIYEVCRMSSAHAHVQPRGHSGQIAHAPKSSGKLRLRAQRPLSGCHIIFVSIGVVGRVIELCLP